MHLVRPQGHGFDQSADWFLRGEKGFPSVLAMSNSVRPLSPGASAEDIRHELVGAFHGKRVDAELRIEKFCCPSLCWYSAPVS